jgi:hypothetical protein
MHRCTLYLKRRTNSRNLRLQMLTRPPTFQETVEVITDVLLSQRAKQLLSDRARNYVEDGKRSCVLLAGGQVELFIGEWNGIARSR